MFKASCMKANDLSCRRNIIKTFESLRERQGYGSKLIWSYDTISFQQIIDYLFSHLRKVYNAIEIYKFWYIYMGKVFFFRVMTTLIFDTLQNDIYYVNINVNVTLMLTSLFIPTFMTS